MGERVFTKGSICKGHSNQKQNQKKYGIFTIDPSRHLMELQKG
jgi:hypothetical protein